MITNFEIYNGYGSDNGLILKAGTTCYRSEEHTKKTGDEFVAMLKSQKHLSVLEFAFYPIKVRVSGSTPDEIQRLGEQIFYNFSAHPHFEVYMEKADILISANARAWFEYFSNSDSLTGYDHNILGELKKRNAAIFGDFVVNPASPRYHVWVFGPAEIRQLVGPVRQIHDWVAVKFMDVSRGFTGEANRHRLFSTAEQSTRYVNMSDLKMLVTESGAMDNPMDQRIVEQYLTVVKTTYDYMMERGYKRDVARHFLPLGTKVNVVKAARIKDWIQFFELRTSDRAHFEIKSFAEAVKAEFIKNKLIEG